MLPSDCEVALAGGCKDCAPKRQQCRGGGRVLSCCKKNFSCIHKRGGNGYCRPKNQRPPKGWLGHTLKCAPYTSNHHVQAHHARFLRRANCQLSLPLARHSSHACVCDPGACSSGCARHCSAVLKSIGQCLSWKCLLGYVDCGQIQIVYLLLCTTWPLKSVASQASNVLAPCCYPVLQGTWQMLWLWMTWTSTCHAPAMPS